MRYQVQWHLGWRDHLFFGQILAVYLFKALIEAVNEIEEYVTTTITTTTTTSDPVGGIVQLPEAANSAKRKLVTSDAAGWLPLLKATPEAVVVPSMSISLD